MTTPLSPYEASVQVQTKRSWLVRGFWFLALIADAFAVFVVYVGMMQANGAPQEAAIAALGCFICMARYVLARAVEEISW